MCKEAQEKQEMQAFEDARVYVAKAQSALLKKLFGFVPDIPGDYAVTRTQYRKAMEEIEQEYDLKEGNPALVLFVLEQLSRSPKFIEEGDNQ